MLLLLIPSLSHGLPGSNEPPGRKVVGPLPKPTPINVFTYRNQSLLASQPGYSSVANDPIRFTLSIDKKSVHLGETIDITIRAELLSITSSLLFQLPGATAYKLKLLLPTGFEQTGGDFSDFVGAELSYPTRTEATYHIIGHFSTLSPGASFRLLRSHGQADGQSLFVEKSTVRLAELSTAKKSLRETAIDSNKQATTRSETLYVDIDNPAIATKSARVAGAEYRGNLEFATCDAVGGWAFDLNASRQSVSLDIYINDAKVATVKADQSRPDVASAFGLSGFSLYGFYWTLPELYKTNKALKISVKLANDDTELAQSPIKTAVCIGSVLPPEITPDPVTPPSANANYRGYLEFATCDVIGGWAIDLNAPKQSVSLDIFINDVKAATIKADQNRSDVPKSFNLSGFELYGYRWNIPEKYKTNSRLKIDVRAAGSSYEVSQSPMTTASCPGSATAASCAFEVAVNSTSATCGSAVTLPAACSGADCQGLTYTWSGNGINQQGQALNLTAPATNGTYAYTVTATKTGCTSKTAVATLTVTGCTPPPTPSGEYRGFLDNANCNYISGWLLDMKSTQKSQSVDIYINNVKAATVVADQVRSDVASVFNTGNFAQFGYSWTIPDSYKNNTPIRISVRAAGSSYEVSQSPMTTASCPGSATAASCAFEVAVSSTSATCGSAVALAAACSGADCQGLTYTWSGNGINQQGQALNLTAPATNGTYAYTVTATKTGCTSKTAVATLTVTGCTPTPSCAFDVAVNSVSATCGSSINLNATCSGANCDNVNYTWTGNGVSQSGQVLALTALSTSGLYSYTMTATKDGCAGKVIVATVTVTGCTTTPSCDFDVSANSVSTSCNGAVSLSASCSGSSCNGVSYAWSGNGVSQQGQRLTLTAPSTDGTYLYAVTASRVGCDNKTAIGSVTVTGCTISIEPYPVLNSPQPADQRPVLQNDRVRVAIDLGVGGVIREITDLQVGENMVNCFVKPDGTRDTGRDDQIALYGYPEKGFTKNGKPILDDIGYNPVQGGSVAGQFSPILGYGRTDKMLYSKTRALHWGIDNEAGDYTIEQWIRLENNIVRQHVRITGDRPERTKYPDSRQQELPCVYTSSLFYQYFVVRGEPYTNAPLVHVNSIQNIDGSGTSMDQYKNEGRMGPFNVDASEPWIAAIRSGSNRGMALHTPYSHEFKAALFHSPGQGTPESTNAGYISNSSTMILDPDGVYEYDINRVVGTLDEIRSTINTLPRSETKPNYVFAGNPTRHGFMYRKGYDQGYPLRGNELTITPTDRRFRLVSPRKGYKAAEFGVIYVRMRAITPERQLLLDWRKVGQTELEAENGSQAIRFNIIPDNQYHTYAIPVKNISTWSGIINNFTIRYTDTREETINGQQFGVKWISATDLGDQ